MNNKNGISFKSAEELLNSLFDQYLKKQGKYDTDVVDLVRCHLGQTALHSKAGIRLAEALVNLAKSRAKEASQ